MKFRTEIIFRDTPFKLNPECPVLLTGSCFADNIGRKISDSGWSSTVNPCGVIYNPESMARLYELALASEKVREEAVGRSITHREGKYVSWLMDSRIAADTPEKAAESCLQKIEILKNAIFSAHAIFITFGTSDVFYLKDSSDAVGNCHKHPAGEFYKKRLGIAEITERWRNLILQARTLNPGVKIIFTVSPRRYPADGFAENSRLKAVLILACEALCKEMENVFYFPAYEILNDDLRDYRFYAEDLLHPASQAVEYIWEKFCECFLDAAGREKIKAGERNHRRSLHRPILPE